MCEGDVGYDGRGRNGSSEKKPDKQVRSNKQILKTIVWHLMLMLVPMLVHINQLYYIILLKVMFYIPIHHYLVQMN